MTDYKQQRGLTLVELMVGLAIGLLLLLGVGLLFTQNQQSYRQNEELARLQEDARFALDELARDIGMAGFISEISDPSAIETDPFHLSVGGQKSCGLSPGSGFNWLYDFSETLLQASLAVGNNLSGAAANARFPCIAADSFQPDTDVVGIKRTSGAPSGWGNQPNIVPATVAAPGNRIYFRESGGQARLLDDAARAADTPIGPWQDWEYSPRIYFVRNFSVTPGDGVPALCRVRLVNDGTGGTPPDHTQECIASGVEDLQLLYGIDTTFDGSANTYVHAPTANDLANLVSVRIYLLMRTINIDVGHRDNRTYQLGDKDPYTPADRFHRRIYSSTVLVRNLRPLQAFN